MKSKNGNCTADTLSAGPPTGRFAPTPSGPLHLGSLLTAVASWTEARHHGGRWLLRIDDLDRPRSQPGAVDAIRYSLDAHGLSWDGPVAYQSNNAADHQQGLAALQQAGRVYPCACSRRDLLPLAGIHPQHCVRKATSATATALRLRVQQDRDTWQDLLQGPITLHPTRDIGDLVVRRRDGIMAWHLASTLDDHNAGVNMLVRGADLLDSTSAQRQIQHALALPSPQWLHLPVLLRPDGHKVSKHLGDPACSPEQAAATVHLCLQLLGQNPPQQLARESAPAQLDWATSNWRRSLLPGGSTLTGFIALAQDEPAMISAHEPHPAA